MSAAALLAAVASRKQQGTAPTLRRNPLYRSNPAKRQPLFGREREGGASLREAASLATPIVLPRLFGREREGGASLREAASLATLSRLPPLLEEFSRLICVGLDLGLEIVYTGELPLGALEVEEIQANLLAVEHQTRV